MEKEIIFGRIMWAIHSCLQWEDGEITGLDIDKLSQKISGILEPSVPKEEQRQHLSDLMKTDEEHGMYDIPSNIAKSVDYNWDKLVEKSNHKPEYKSTCPNCGSKNTAANAHNHLDKCLNCKCEYHNR